jgi:hypothetical protein
MTFQKRHNINKCNQQTMNWLLQRQKRRHSRPFLSISHRYTNMSCIVLFCILLVLFNSDRTRTTTALPYIVLKNKAPYCYSTDTLASHTTYTLQYHAPDMVIVSEVENHPNHKVPYNNIVPPPQNPDTDNHHDPTQQHILERQQKQFDILKRSVRSKIFVVVVVYGIL